MQNLSNITIGIWGYGKVGQSAVSFLRDKCRNLIVMDQKATRPDNLPLDIEYLNQEQKQRLFNKADIIVPSPGIDINPYLDLIGDKILTELDLFFHYFHKPIIAITGSVGKTTITSLLGQLLKLYDAKIAIGGNIGIPCLDLINNQNNIDYALLEVSSFQLEHCRYFAPHIGIITNLVPNHLDRHNTMDQYRTAKLNIFARQKRTDYGFVPKNIFPFISKDIQSRIKLFDDSLDSCTLPPITFRDNWIIITTLLNHLECDLSKLPAYAQQLRTVEHRLEYVTTINNVLFYNDSKATTPASTIAAVQAFSGKNIHLLLGGLSKGVNRKALIEQLKGKVSSIACFGDEADQLDTWCNEYNIPSSSHTTLQVAIRTAFNNAQKNETIILSPGGSSFDLFKNFEERGKTFKALTHELKTYYATSKSERVCIQQKNK